MKTFDCRVAVLAATIVMTCGPVAAAQLTATPENFASVLARAQGGDILILKGVFTAVKLKGRRFERPLIIDASAATLVAWKIDDVSGLSIKGGVAKPTSKFEPKRNAVIHGSALAFNNVSRIRLESMRFQGPEAPVTDGLNPADGYGAYFRYASDIDVVDCEFRSFKSAALFGQTDRFKLQRSTFRAMRSDGVNVANSWNGLIENNDFRETNRTNKEHPDAIQMWSRPKAKPTSDIVIRGNTVVGSTQGITGFNHVRDGVDDGGFDRILIVDNDVQVGFAQAIAVGSGRDIKVMNNRVRTLPGAAYRASINVSHSPGAVRSGNIVEPGAGKRGDSDPDAPSSFRGQRR